MYLHKKIMCGVSAALSICSPVKTGSLLSYMAAQFYHTLPVLCVLSVRMHIVISRALHNLGFVALMV